MMWKEVLAFLGDFYVIGNSFANGLINPRKKFKIFKMSDLKMKPMKFILLQVEVSLLG